jgi:acetylornithine deacetylase/succinyl-diaminopimelate desuccinylase-like protein
MMKSAGVTFDGTLELSFVADEESGGYKGAAALVEAGTLHPDVAIVGEPTRLNIVRAQRGIAWLRIVTRGLAGHGSAPERGINAIRHMAAVIDALEPTLPDIHHDLLGGPTISVGTISGGEKLNIIPARCEIEVDRRLLPGETEASMLATIEEAFDRARARFPNLDASVEVVHLGFPFECDPEALVVREAVAAIGEVSGTAPEIVGFRGASDARFFAETGADVVVFGPGDITVAHTADEFIDLDELERGALAYSLLFGRLLGAR